LWHSLHGGVFSKVDWRNWGDALPGEEHCIWRAEKNITHKFMVRLVTLVCNPAFRGRKIGNVFAEPKEMDKIVDQTIILTGYRIISDANDQCLQVQRAMPHAA
jgi:hypothetical protein